jgi:hypothetical protein
MTGGRRGGVPIDPARAEAVLAEPARLTGIGIGT